MYPIITAHHTLVIYNIYIRYMRSGSLLHYIVHLSSRTYYHLVAGLFKHSPAIRVRGIQGHPPFTSLLREERRNFPTFTQIRTETTMGLSHSPLPIGVWKHSEWFSVLPRKPLEPRNVSAVHFSILPLKEQTKKKVELDIFST